MTSSVGVVEVQSDDNEWYRTRVVTAVVAVGHSSPSFSSDLDLSHYIEVVRSVLFLYCDTQPVDVPLYHILHISSLGYHVGSYIGLFAKSDTFV